MRPVIRIKHHEGQPIVATDAGSGDQLEPAAIDPDPPAREVLNATQVAELLDIHPNTVTQWYRSGKLPAPRQIGQTLRWTRRAILDWIEAAELDGMLHGTVQKTQP